jgi:hypothetical protein
MYEPPGQDRRFLASLLKEKPNAIQEPASEDWLLAFCHSEPQAGFKFANCIYLKIVLKLRPLLFYLWNGFGSVSFKNWPMGFSRILGTTLCSKRLSNLPMCCTLHRSNTEASSQKRPQRSSWTRHLHVHRVTTVLRCRKFQPQTRKTNLSVLLDFFWILLVGFCWM